MKPVDDIPYPLIRAKASPLFVYSCVLGMFSSSWIEVCIPFAHFRNVRSDPRFVGPHKT